MERTLFSTLNSIDEANISGGTGKDEYKPADHGKKYEDKDKDKDKDKKYFDIYEYLKYVKYYIPKIYVYPVKKH